MLVVLLRGVSESQRLVSDRVFRLNTTILVVKVSFRVARKEIKPFDPQGHIYMS